MKIGRGLQVQSSSIARSIVIAAVLLTSGCSAKLDAEPRAGIVRGYASIPDVTHAIRLTWKCTATSLASALFSPSGESGCNKASARGQITIPVSEAGKFRVPTIGVKVRQLFSIPSFIIKWELVTTNEEGVEHSELLLGTRVSDNLAFQEIIETHSQLRFFRIEDACIAASIVAVDGSNRYPFDELLREYPDSRVPKIRTLVSITIRNHGTLVANRRFSFPFRNGQFCMNNVGFFLVDDGNPESLAFDYELRTSANAYVVYEVSDVDQRSGQKSIRGEYKERNGTRSAVAGMATPIYLPQELLAPIEWEIDVSETGQ